METVFWGGEEGKRGKKGNERKSRRKRLLQTPFVFPLFPISHLPFQPYTHNLERTFA
jgi:hypothetical protein